MLRSPTKTSSTPDLRLEEETSNINTRKRKQNFDTEDVATLRSEFIIGMSKLKDDQDEKFKKLTDSMEEMKVQNGQILQLNKSLQMSLEKLMGMYVEIKTTVDDITKEHNKAMLKINSLEEQIKELQRKQRLSTVEINNVPVQENEDLRKVVDQIHTSLQVSIKPDFKQLYRNKNSKNKPIIVEYQKESDKKLVFEAYKKYNNKNKNSKLSLGIKDKRIIYISESLSPTMKKLHFEARDLVKNYGYKFCWVSNGKIFVRKTENGPAIHIRLGEQIEELRLGVINADK